jgi:hypothetical protein
VAVEDDARLEAPAEQGHADRQLVDEEDVERPKLGQRLECDRYERREREREGERQVQLAQDGEDDMQRVEQRPRECAAEDVDLERACEATRTTREDRKGWSIQMLDPVVAGRGPRGAPSCVSSKHLVGSCREVKSSTECPRRWRAMAASTTRRSAPPRGPRAEIKRHVSYCAKGAAL